MADRLIWASVMRPQMPLVYLDINHLIELARAMVDASTAHRGYVDLLAATRRAVHEKRALLPLSGEHLWEITAIKSPRQRHDIADVMEELSGFNYLLGRTEIAQLEVEAGIEDIFDEHSRSLAFPLVRATFGQAFGMRGGMSIRNADGSDGSDAARLEMGDAEYEQFIRHVNYTVERGMLDGPSDEEVPILRTQYGYDPEKSREGAQSRLAFELDLTERLAKYPRWRRGRLRDVVSAREVAHEWLDIINRVNEQRARDGKRQLDSDDDTRRLMASMPHTQVAISIKTQYHRNPNHRWDTNDITDIDAASVAYAYCDAVFTDKAARAALANSTELRPIGTYLPRTPADLCEWLDDLPSLAVPGMLDEWLVGELAAASLPIFANSALNASDRDRIGNDFAAFAPAGIVAAEFLTEGDVVRYHTAEDNVTAIDPGVVQDHGDTMVALAEHFGNLDLTAARIADSDLVFLSIPVLGLVAYPVWLAQALTVIASAVFLVVVAAVWRRRHVSGVHLAGSTLVVPALAAAFTALAWAAWQRLLAMNPESEQTLHYPDFERSTTAMAVIGAVAGLAFVAACHWLANRIGVIELAVGTLVWWTLLAVLLVIWEPLFSPVALWPLVGGVAAVAVAAWVSHPWSRVGLLALAAIPGLVVVVPLLILEALNVEQGPLVAVPVLVLLLGSLLPQLLLITGRLGPPTNGEPERKDQVSRT